VAEKNETAALVIRTRETACRPPAPAGFEDFFRSSFRKLVKTAMYLGATQAEAEDATAKAIMEMLPHWETIRSPLTYARRAVAHNFIKERERGLNRVTRRLVERGEVPQQEGLEDSQLTVWEDSERVKQVLSCLTPAQREVMECIAEGLGRSEIADALGKTEEAIRRHICDARRRLTPVLQEKHEPEQRPRKVTSSPRKEA
jgi:RNA polymerase sigma-70 factor (ECF subfamily)